MMLSRSVDGYGGWGSGRLDTRKRTVRGRRLRIAGTRMSFVCLEDLERMDMALWHRARVRCLILCLLLSLLLCPRCSHLFL